MLIARVQLRRAAAAAAARAGAGSPRLLGGAPSLPSAAETRHFAQQHRRSRAPRVAFFVSLGAGTVLGAWFLDNRARELEQRFQSTSWDEDWDAEWRPFEPPADPRPASAPTPAAARESAAGGPADAAGLAANAVARSDPKGGRRSLAEKHIVLVRHGQYEHDGFDDENRKLTPLGLRQAAEAGARLAAELRGARVRAIFHSPMCRARQTAVAIGRHFPGVPLVEDEALAEGAPIPPAPPCQHWQPPAEVFEIDGPRIESAFRKYFFRPPAGGGGGGAAPGAVYDIVVCHGNVIRYMFCRALQFPPNAWLRLVVPNCGVTKLVVNEEGTVSCRALGETGFLPHQEVTVQ